MKILHVSPSVAASYGGPTASLIGFCRAAASAGWDIAVAAPRPTREDELQLASQLPDASFQLFPSTGTGAAVISPSLWLWLKKAAKSAEVVHVHGLLNPVSSLSARIAQSRRPTIIRPFGTLSAYTFQHRRSLEKQVYYRLLDGPNLRNAPAIHFTAESEAVEAQRWPEVDASRSYVVPPPVSISPTVGAKRNGRTVLFLSRLHPVKRVSLLLDAWKRVTAVRHDLRLIVAGDGDPEYVKSLRRHADGLGVSPSVDFTGFADATEKQRLLSEASLFVLPSAHENFGMAVLEAMAAGLPVVVTPEVALASFVEQHRLGFIADPNESGLASSICAALEDHTLGPRCERVGSALVADAFSAERVAARLSAMYHAVACK